MPKYENSVIYKLVHKNDQDNENIYVGSTTNFRGRKIKHKNKCCNENALNGKTFVYQFIRENGGWDEWEMLAIETYPCESKRELEIRERYHIETLKPKLNKQLPTRTHKEYLEDNKEEISIKNKEYRNNNKEKIKEQKKKYHQDNRDKILEKNKQYRQENIEEISKKDKIRQRINITCECGCILRKYSLKDHLNTDKHKKNLSIN